MSSQPTRIVVHGALGRMGARLCALAMQESELDLVAAIDARAPHPPAQRAVPHDDAAPLIENTLNSSVSCDVIVDFSSDAGAAAAVQLALDRGAALLVGTTALGPATRSALREAAEKISLLIAPNTSAGVAATAEIVRLAAALLGDRADVSIVEAHHSAKKDAPSGTAIRLANAAREGGATVRDEQILSIRGGDVIGEHTVRLACADEYIEITHRATSRDLFARGALRAARWLASQPPGLYTIEDALGMPRRMQDRA